jgi:cytochrome oxidase Cu insertion factor (SCO1/SenC/PrrC family)
VSESAVTRDRRQRRLLIALALLFFAPLGLTFYLYYGPVGWRPAGRVNHGDLIDPPRRLPALALPLVAAGSVATARSTDPDFLKHKWTLLYFGPGTCSRRCRTNLYNTRQVRTALNRDQGRVQRVYIAEGACCDMESLRTEHPDLITVRATPAAAPLLALLPSVDGLSPAAAARIYLIDPLGNLMMSYAPDADPKGMLEDLQRLLRLSHVG